ncbi:rubrerythrin family protein [Streptomyces sp. S1A]|uniref:rubrerythrin family protein n=1 Tax=Streptomyces sp. ICN903 TaxID=2964654 RepID=UPI001ED9FB46|nr:rubrerythrin family protein [Streptomyces sp. ICN903]MCG3039796.1 rubrerythrin family protein [Streptomyces sp. ICN903]
MAVTTVPVRALTSLALAAAVLGTAVSGAAATGNPAPEPPAKSAQAQAKKHGPLALSTVEDLRSSMQGEAYAHASYTFYAAQADREGKHEAAKAFRTAAHTELWEHFAEQAELIGLVGSNEANLRHAIEGETHEAYSMYPTFAAQARQDGDIKAAELFTEIAADEDAHRKAFTTALKAITTGKGKIPAPPAVDRTEVPAGLPKVSSPRTRANLETAMRGEALAHASYTFFAQHARKSGNGALADLFAGTARVELHEHFAEEGVLAGLVSDTAANLRKSIEGEWYEAKVMYPKFAERARKAGDPKAAHVFADTAGDEAAHARSFEKALRDLK